MNKIFEVNIIELIAGGLLIFVCSVWIVKVWNNKRLRKQKAQVDEYIETLKAQQAQKVASLENELKADRHALRLAQTHLIEKRVAVIDQCYKTLVDFDQAIVDVKSSDKTHSPQEAYDLAVLRFTAFASFFERNRVYFSAGMVKKVATSHTSIGSVLDLIVNPTLAKGNNEEQQSFFKKLDSEINRSRQEIEAEMRAILQIDNALDDIDGDNALSMFH